MLVGGRVASSQLESRLKAFTNGGRLLMFAVLVAATLAACQPPPSGDRLPNIPCTETDSCGSDFAVPETVEPIASQDISPDPTSTP